MTRKSLTIAGALRALRDVDENPSEPHLSFELLLSYYRGETPAEETERIEAHFARCQSCAEQAKELAQFLEPEDSLDEAAADDGLPRALTPAETEAVWQQLRGSLPIEASTKHRGGGRPARLRWYQRTSLLQAVAAGLLVAAFVAPYAVWQSTQRRLARFQEAEPNVPVVSLEAAAFRRDVGQPVPRPTPAPPGALLILLPDLAPEPIDHRVEIQTAAGERIDVKPGLRPTDLGQFHLRLPRNLSPGQYRIRILYPQQDHAERFLVLVEKPAAR